MFKQKFDPRTHYKGSDVLSVSDAKGLFNAIKDTAGSDPRQSRTIRRQLADKFVNDMIDKEKLSPYAFNPVALARAELPFLNELHDLSQLNTSERAEAAFALNVGDFGNILHSVLRRVAKDAYEYPGMELLQLVKEDTAQDSEYEDIPAFTDIPVPTERLRSTEFDEATFGADKVRLWMRDMGIIISLEFELLFSARKFGGILEQAANVGEGSAMAIGKSIVQTIEMGDNRDIFNRSEADSNYGFWLNGSDAHTDFYSTDHSSLDGQTNNNNRAIGAVSWEMLEDVFKAFAAMTDTAGKPISLGMPQALLPLQVKHEMDSLLQSPLRITKDSGNNLTGEQINTFANAGITPFYTPYTAASNAGYFGDFKKAIKLLWLERPDMIRHKSEDTSFYQRTVMAFRWSAFWGIGARDYRYIVKATLA